MTIRTVHPQFVLERLDFIFLVLDKAAILCFPALGSLEEYGGGLVLVKELRVALGGGSPGLEEQLLPESLVAGGEGGKIRLELSEDCVLGGVLLAGGGVALLLAAVEEELLLQALDDLGLLVEQQEQRGHLALGGGAVLGRREVPGQLGECPFRPGQPGQQLLVGLGS